MPRRSDRLRNAVLLLLALLCLSIGSVAYADEPLSDEQSTEEAQPTQEPATPIETSLPTELPPTDAPTEPPPVTAAANPTTAPTEPPPAATRPATTPTEPVTETPPATAPADEGTGEPTTEPTEEDGGSVGAATDEPATEPTEEGDEPAAEATEDLMSMRQSGSLGGMIQPLAMQTSCEMTITDAGDDNPFTFQFDAIANNIASYAWTFGDGNTSAIRNPSHTYATAGDYTITLECAPQGGGAPLALTGQITITPVLSADFDLLPGTTFTALPQTVTTENHSSGGTLTYDWKISTSSNPSAPGIYTATTQDISYTFTSADFSTYPATFYFHLKVTNGAQTRLVTKSVVFNIVPPKADFTLSPVAGTAPLTVTVEGVPAAASGPIDSWTWDFGDGIGTATGPGPHSYTYTVENTYWITLNYSGPGGSGEVKRQVGVYAGSTPVDAGFTYAAQGEVVISGVTYYRFCFTNTSTGPFVSSVWDFGDGQTETNNAAVVCHNYTTSGNFTVKLSISDGDIEDPTTSTTTQAISVVAQPVANFNISPGATITWGTTVNFTDTSTGIITQYQWDFGNGQTSTDRNPSGILLNTLGANPIRLTVTGPGGSSYVEKIVTVNRLELTCDFNGKLNVLPNEGSQTYTAALGNIGGRNVTYNWTITGTGAGLPMSFTTQNISVDWASIGIGAFQVTLNASTEDGSNCNTTKTVTRDWQPLQCDMTSNLPGTLYANGQNYTFTAVVDSARLGGRTPSYQWLVDGVPQAGQTGTSFTWTNTTDTSSLPRTVVVSYTVTVNNGPDYTPATSDCTETRSFTVQPWPNLVCSGISGNFSPLPTTPDNSARSSTYTANISGLAGRQVSYNWSVDGGTITSTNPSSSNQATVQWDPNRAQPGHTGPENIAVTVTVNNPDSTTVTCSMNSSLSVTLPNLTCGAPTGDIAPVVGETELYTRHLSNEYGRAITAFNWEMQQETSPGTWTPVLLSNATNNPLPFQFLEPGAKYRLRYNATAEAWGSVPADSCASSWLNIGVFGTGVGFQCESNLTGPGTVTTAGPHSYSISVDNGNHYNLQYRYTLTDWMGEPHQWTETSTGDGSFSRSFWLAQLGPHGVGSYTLHVEVSEVGATHTTYTCDRSITLNVGTLTANYTYSAGGWSNTAIPVGQQICFDNTSTTLPTSPLAYTWTIGGNPAHNSLGVGSSTDEDLSCLSFSQPGSYTIALEAKSNSGRTHTHSRTFTVYGLQSISINRSGSAFAPSTQSFSAVGTNITGGYTWQFYPDGSSTLLGTRTNQTNVTFNFTTPGKYRAVVTGTGPLGPTQAMLEFTLLASNSLAARFRASQYAGVGPFESCFTDNSVSGSPITQWEWDLDGDGTYELVYGPTNKPASICHTYDGPGTKTQVRLRVTNANFTDTATNVIRVYSLLEQSASFSVTPNGAGSYCFTALLPDGVVVTGWDFGDGITGGAAESICHSFGAAGTYIVTMKINGGEVIREVEVPANPAPAPNLSVTAVCSPQRTASFTVTNSGGAMATPDQVTIRDLNGNIIRIDSFRLGANESKIISVSDVSGKVTFASTDFNLSAETTCNYPPELSIAATCTAGHLPSFTITNARPTDGPMADPQNFEIRDSQGGLVRNGTFQLTAGQASINIPVPPGSNPYETYTFTSNGASGNLSLSHRCAEPPQLTVTSQCANPIAFTVTNNGGDMVLGQAYTITGGSTPINGTLNLAAGASTAITLTGLDPYAEYIFSSSGFAGQLDLTQDCANPLLVVTSQCANPIAFTVTNNGGDMLLNQAYTIVNGSGVTVASGTGRLRAGASTTITLTGLDPYASYRFRSNGFAGQLDLTQDCANPVLVVTSQCANPIAFTVTNNGGDMLVGQAYTIVSGGTTVNGGTLNLAAGAGTTITLTGLDPYAEYIFSSSGFAGQLDLTQDCANPLLVVTSQCANPIAFTVTNNGGDMLLDQPYTIVDSNGDPAGSGVLNLAAGAGTTITLTGLSPYTGYTFDTTGFAGNRTLTQDCADPLLVVTSQCANPIVFTVTNNGGDMLLDQAYTITGGPTPITGTLNLAAGAGTTITLTGLSPYAGYTFDTTGFAGDHTLTQDCADPLLVVTSQCANPIVFTVTNNGGEMLLDQAYTITGGPTPITGTLNLAAGAGTTISLTGLDPYAGYTFDTNGWAGDHTLTQDCADPLLVVTSQCANPIAFTVSNNGGDMLLDQPYTIVDGNGDSAGSGMLNLAAGAGTTISLTGLDPYAGYTFDTNGWAGDHTLTQECERPLLEITSQCAETIVFSVTNNSGQMLVGQAYTVVNGNGDEVASGTFDLDVNGSTTVELTGLDPYAGYTLTSTGFAGSYSRTQNCERPALNPTTQCADIVAFTVTNDGGQMLAAQPYTVTDAGGATVVSDMLNLDAGDSATITVPDANPYQTYTLTTDGFAGTLNFAYQCEAPVLRVSTSCEAPSHFIITNVGGDMLATHNYGLFSEGRNVTPAGASFLLLKGQSLRINEPGVDMARGLRFITDDLGIYAEARFQCEMYTELAALITPTPDAMSTLTPRGGGNGFGGIATEELELDWNAARMCGFGCPTFRVYHTNEPDNWNIFRLDGADQETRQSFRRNLSFGEGPDVRDVSPSLSPNEQWVIFSSNRDGNWELYVASTSGDPTSVRRVTFNTIATDTDPVWGPNNFVAFESTRNGQWDIYLIDMSTGLEYRLTDDSGNDINPYWSPDGSRLLFQSDRPDGNGVRQWQVYEIALGSKAITRLSDGTSIDVDPQFSNDGRRIVYRTYAEDGANSVIMLMDADGRNKRAITSPAEDATNPVWSPRDRYIAYQSNLDGDLDIYVYEVATEQTRHLTDNDIPDYAPTWDCSEEIVVFTSDIAGNPDIYDAEVQPITAGPIRVDEGANQLTFETFDDIYPQSFPPEENASREGQTVRGNFGEQTVFLLPDPNVTRIDPSLNRERRDDWPNINGCAGR